MGWLLFAAIIWCAWHQSWGWMTLWIILWLLWVGRNAPDNEPKPQPTGPTKPGSSKPKSMLLTPVDYPAPADDEDYGIGDTDLTRRLHSCRARVHGTPGGGLNASGFGSARVNAGQRGEKTIAKALLYYGILDDPQVNVWFSLRNPGDQTGNTDIDVVLLKAGRLYAIDAKHYTPDHINQWLRPTNDDTGSQWMLPVTQADGTPTGRTYTATSNMRWVTNALTELYGQAVRITPIILLARTRNGVYGTFATTRWPGAIPCRNADQWITGVLKPELAKLSGMAHPNVIQSLDRLTKTTVEPDAEPRQPMFQPL